MKPTIKSIHKRMDKVRDFFGEHSRYVLMSHPLTRRAVCLVELSRPADANVLTRQELKILCERFIEHVEFDTYYIDEETANACGVNVGKYLCISYYL